MRSILICLLLLIGHSTFSQERKVHLVPIEIIEPRYNDTFDEDKNGTKRVGVFAFTNQGPDSLLMGDRFEYFSKFSRNMHYVLRALAPGETDTIKYTYISTAIRVSPPDLSHDMRFCIYISSVYNQQNIEITKKMTAYVDPDKQLCTNIIYYSIYFPRPEKLNFIDSSIINNPPSTYYYSLFPNPANGYFFVRLTDEEINPQQVELIDATGKIRLLEFEIFSPTLIRVNVAQMAKGLYVFRLIAQDAVRTEKVQIE